MAAGRLGRVEAVAVVVDLQNPGVALQIERDPAGGGGGVAADVGEGLAGQLDQVAGPAGQLGRGRRVDLGDGHHPGALAELDQALQRLVELAVGQDPRAQAEDVAAGRSWMTRSSSSTAFWRRAAEPRCRR